MSTVIVFAWDEQRIHATVVEGGSAPRVVAQLSEAHEGTGESKPLGEKLRQMLAAHSPGKATVAVAVCPEALEWQHLSLPPSPLEDLPDMVRLQADPDILPADLQSGFDFLPLAGDGEHPYRVLVVAVRSNYLQKVRDICRVADLKPAHMMPLSIGWVGLAAAGQQLHGDESGQDNIYATPLVQSATIWATTADRVSLLRQVQLPEATEAAALESALQGQLRRTQLSLTQERPGVPARHSIWLVGGPPQRLQVLASTLSEHLETSVQPLVLPEQFQAESTDVAPKEVALPLAGIGLDLALGKKPLVDLLNPRHRPEQQRNWRTIALAATAASLLVGLGGWQAYRSLQAPLLATESAEEQLESIEPQLDEYRKLEQYAAEVRGWLDQSVDLLGEFRELSEIVRPKPLGADDYVPEQDSLLTKVDITGKRLTLTAHTRNEEALRILEERLRSGSARVQRDSLKKDDSIPGYQWQVRFLVDADPDTSPGEANVQ